MGRCQLRIVGFFVTQIINAAVCVKPNSFQGIVPWKMSFSLKSYGQCAKENRRTVGAI
jgi:hypothetical protein